MHAEYLLQALALAQTRRGLCTPNPSVGAVIVKDDLILARACHWQAGAPHAEINAFLQVEPSKLQDATLYVTLEPCCHHGKTPPCVDAIIRAGIKKVYFAAYDPNPKVAAQSAQLLKAAGIECEHFPLDDITEFYNSYHHWWQTQTPWLTAKIAMSLDGKIAGANGRAVAITGELTRRWVHEQRLQSDAILTTVETVLADNPQLNVRLDHDIISKPIYLLDRLLQLPSDATILTTANSLVIFCSDSVSLADQEVWRERNVRIIPIPVREEHLDLQLIHKSLGRDGLFDVWLECGSRAISAFLNASLVNTLHVNSAPKLLGPNALSAELPALDLFKNDKQCHIQKMGSDTIYTINL